MWTFSISRNWGYYLSFAAILRGAQSYTWFFPALLPPNSMPAGDSCIESRVVNRHRPWEETPWNHFNRHFNGKTWLYFLCRFLKEHWEKVIYFFTMFLSCDPRVPDGFPADDVGVLDRPWSLHPEGLNVLASGPGRCSEPRLMTAQPTQERRTGVLTRSPPWRKLRSSPEKRHPLSPILRQIRRSNLWVCLETKFSSSIRDTCQKIRRTRLVSRIDTFICIPVAYKGFVLIFTDLGDNSTCSDSILAELIENKPSLSEKVLRAPL